MPSGFLVIS